MKDHKRRNKKGAKGPTSTAADRAERPDAPTADSVATTTTRPAGLPADGRRRVVIGEVIPAIDGGRYPVKRTPGETVIVEADIFADGHDVIAGVVRHRAAPRTANHGDGSASPGGAASDRDWSETPLVPLGNDRWQARFAVGDVGRHEFTIEAWIDHFASWRRDLDKRVAAGQDVASELLEGAAMVREAAHRAVQDADRDLLSRAAQRIASADTTVEPVLAALDPGLAALMAAHPDRRQATRADRVLPIEVDRERARFGSWYEMFPRSAGPDPSRSATFREAAGRLSEIAAMGFDVLYLPPIHPIGRTNRKGPNNSLAAGPDDPGSPWAIGGTEGGHTAVHPDLGTLADFHWFRDQAARHGLELALDIAFQCSPDHPYATAHPEWFRHRPDGTIKYAENPPKKYQDIYPFDFDSEAWPSLWDELCGVIRFWVDQGVRIFRVDNPHTKALPFWEWTIARIHEHDPGVIFLAEAFTRPRVMQHLAKVGFTQSYTYFTWRNSKAELEEYFTELTTAPLVDYLRPNLFANTPDILHEYLQEGGTPAFRIRAVLAATLGATWGIYSGFELGENLPVRPGSEEYLDSEKYQIRRWDWNRPGHLKELIARLNAIRRSERAFQFDRGLRFHLTSSPALIAYSKVDPDDEAAGPAPLHRRVLVVVALDPHAVCDGWVCTALPDVPVAEGERYLVHDLLSDRGWRWQSPWNYVRLDPAVAPAHIFRIARP